MDCSDFTPNFDDDSDQEGETEHTTLKKRISEVICEKLTSSPKMPKSSCEKDFSNTLRTNEPQSSVVRNIFAPSTSNKEGVEPKDVDSQPVVVISEMSSTKGELSDDASSEDDFPSILELMSPIRREVETDASRELFLHGNSSPGSGEDSCFIRSPPTTRINSSKVRSSEPLSIRRDACYNSSKQEKHSNLKCTVILEDVLNRIVDKCIQSRSKPKSYRVSNIDVLKKPTECNASECINYKEGQKKKTKISTFPSQDIVPSSAGESSSEEESRILPMISQQKKRSRKKRKRDLPHLQSMRSEEARQIPKFPILELDSTASECSVETDDEGNIVVKEDKRSKRKSPRKKRYRVDLRKNLQKFCYFDSDVLAIHKDNEVNSCDENSLEGSIKEERDLLSSSFVPQRHETQALRVILQPIPKHVLQKWRIEL